MPGGIIMRFLPPTKSVDLLSVVGLPGGNTTVWERAGIAYVPRLKRVFVVGGESYNVVTGEKIWHDEIWSIDLP